MSIIDSVSPHPHISFCWRRTELGKSNFGSFGVLRAAWGLRTVITLAIHTETGVYFHSLDSGLPDNFA